MLSGANKFAAKHPLGPLNELFRRRVGRDGPNAGAGSPEASQGRAPADSSTIKTLIISLGGRPLRRAVYQAVVVCHLRWWPRRLVEALSRPRNFRSSPSEDPPS